MRDQPGWNVWEAEVNDALGLTSTSGSGSQWHDKGDGYTDDDVYPLQVDAKYTEAVSLSVNAKKIGQWAKQAAESGRNFALPIRFWSRGALHPDDYVVIPFDDYVELVKKYRNG